MVFIEATLFTKKLKYYLNDDQYNALQNLLMENPATGDIISGTGGLRKIRWGLKDKGKRGGVRIIYFWQKSEHQIYLLTIYAKNEMDDLSASDKKALKQMIGEW